MARYGLMRLVDPSDRELAQLRNGSECGGPAMAIKLI